MEEIPLLPQTAEYALRVAAWLAALGPVPVTSRDLARATGIPPRYLYRVLQLLVRAGLLRSRSGPGGGYELAREANRITMLDVICAVGQVRRIRACPLARAAVGGHLCPLHQTLDAAFAQIEQALRRVTIAQLAGHGDLSPMCQPVSKSTGPGKVLSAARHR